MAIRRRWWGKEQHKSAQSLLEVCAELCGQHRLNLFQTPKRKTIEKHGRDLQDIIGQQQGKRALEIAAAGNHNLLLLEPKRPINEFFNIEH